MNLQNTFENTLFNFLSLSEVLDKDLDNLLMNDDGSDSWKRNFVRSSVALIEGYCHCFKEFSQVALDVGSKLSNNRLKAIVNESGCSASERIRLTIQSAYDVFEIDPSPDFGDEKWCMAKKAIAKRSDLMHPKTAQELEISAEDWQEYYEGIAWLIHASYSLIDEANKKYGT